MISSVKEFEEVIPLDDSNGFLFEGKDILDGEDPIEDKPVTIPVEKVETKGTSHENEFFE